MSAFLLLFLSVQVDRPSVGSVPPSVRHGIRRRRRLASEAHESAIYQAPPSVNYDSKKGKERVAASSGGTFISSLSSTHV